MLLFLLAPQAVTIGFPVTLTNATITAPETPAAAINDTACATDFSDLIPTDNRFDDRLIADWGDLDDGCDFYPQNENTFN